MPSYDYKCKTCEASYTQVRGFNEEEIKPICTKCNTECGRVFGVAAVTFNGAGFYATDKKK